MPTPTSWRTRADRTAMAVASSLLFAEEERAREDAVAAAGTHGAHPGR
jgi:hypothetical protein